MADNSSEGTFNPLFDWNRIFKRSSQKTTPNRRPRAAKFQTHGKFHKECPWKTGHLNFHLPRHLNCRLRLLRLSFANKLSSKIDLAANISEVLITFYVFQCLKNDFQSSREVEMKISAEIEISGRFSLRKIWLSNPTFKNCNPNA